MSFYALRMKPDSVAYSQKNVSTGREMGFLGNAQGLLLLYSSKEKANNKIKSMGLEKIEIFLLDSPAGFFLVEIASIDHFSSAILDDNSPIIFFSCSSGRFLLPSHFYLKSEEGFKALQRDDKWHKRDINFDNPTCACGGILSPFNPIKLKFKNTKIIPGIIQVIIGNHTTHDGTSCITSGFIDLAPPTESYCLEVALGGSDGKISLYYFVTPEGFNYVESEYSFYQIEPWCIHPLTNMTRIWLQEITSNNGMEWCELYLSEKNIRHDIFDSDDLLDDLLPKSILRRVKGTGKAKNIPTIQYEFIPKMVKDHISKATS